MTLGYWCGVIAIWNSKYNSFLFSVKLSDWKAEGKTYLFNLSKLNSIENIEPPGRRNKPT